MKICNINFASSVAIKKRTAGYKEQLPSVNFGRNQAGSVPYGYHRTLFESAQSVSQINFVGLSAEAKMLQLKSALKQICEESIERYERHDIHISQNLFTRGFIQHSFDFVEKDGDIFHNLKDPFYHDNWYFHRNMKNRMTVKGLTLGEECVEKMQKGIEGWNEKFLEIISREKAEGKNNLLEELLNKGSDIQQIKKHLGII